MNYYSQIGQDKYYIEQVVNFKRNGVFLDVGANDGLFESNTFALESQLDWTGVCVEANPTLGLKLKQNRPSAKIVQAAAWNKSGEVEFEITESNKDNIPGHLLSRVADIEGNDSYFSGHFEESYTRVKVEAKTITEILSDQLGLPCTIDYMSLDTEGAELAALQGIDFSAVNIQFMSIEHGNRPGRIQEFENYLRPFGYDLHRVNAWDVEFCKVKKPSSWDCFDTLVFRRLKTPESVFNILESKLNIPGFTAQRKSAEQRAPETIDKIYQELAKVYNWSQEEYQTALELEVSTEIEECLPVRENISKVRRGDIVVSDMYLAEEHIRRILNKCGITHNIPIHVSYGGKHNGWIWSTLPELSHHTGDNYHSDVDSASRYGIKATYYTDTLDFTDKEKIAGDELALLMRAVRLMNPYAKGDPRYTLWLEQSQLNIPVLVLASLQLPKNNLAFVHRDCVHLQAIHEALHDNKSTEFHCSRIALSNTDDAVYKEYVYSSAYSKTIVDLHGTGKSLNDYWEEVFSCSPDLLYITGRARGGRTVLSVTSDILEKYNSSKLGTLLGWPERKQNEFNPDYLEAQHAAIAEAVKLIPTFSFKLNKAALNSFVHLMGYGETPNIMKHEENHGELFTKKTTASHSNAQAVTFHSYKNFKSYVINLDRERWRYGAALANLSGLGFTNIARWKASDFQEEDVNEEFRKMGAKYLQRFYTNGEVACSLSHWRVWADFLSGTDPYCLVFEDDVVGSSNFWQTADFYDLNYGEFDLLILGGSLQSVTPGETPDLKAIKEAQGNRTYIRDWPGFLSHAYMISRKGAYTALFDYMQCLTSDEHRPPQLDHFLLNNKNINTVYSSNHDIPERGLRRFPKSALFGLLHQDGSFSSTIQNY